MAGTTGIVDATNPARQMTVNADGSINITGSLSPPANQRVSSQANDFVSGSIVDLLTLLTLAGTAGDANTVNSLMGRLTKIRDLLNGTLAVNGAVTEANSAAILADLATIAGAISAAAMATNLSKVAGNAIAPGSNALPILNSAATGYVAAYGSNLAALVANTDYLFKWGASGLTQVNHILLFNGWTGNLLYDLDTATNAGSPYIIPGQTLILDVQTSVLHMQANGTPNVNGSAASNIIVRGWL